MSSNPDHIVRDNGILSSGSGAPTIGSAIEFNVDNVSRQPSVDQDDEQSRLARLYASRAPYMEMYENDVPPGDFLAGEDVVAVALEERERTIDKYLETNKNHAPAMSRACGVCRHESPLHRAVFTACGHVVCRACSEKLAYDAVKEIKEIICPFCRNKTDFVPLFENPIEEIDN